MADVHFWKLLPILMFRRKEAKKGKIKIEIYCGIVIYNDVILLLYKIKIIQIFKMYSNYLTEVGKLVYIIGEIEVTSSFKKMIDVSNQYRNKYFFKCVDELPVNAYRKVKIQCRRRGILRRDWFNKMLDRAPLMIFMVFNCAQPLEQNQKWEDRLSIIIRKINKVYDILKSSNKEDVVFRIILIISKESVLSQTHSQTVNIVDKIKIFLRNYEKQLQIFQNDILNKQINKHRNVWHSYIDKVYERKYRSISKRMEESYIQKRLCCLIKLAIMAEIMQKKQCFTQYLQAYRSVHYRYIETIKSSSDIISFDLIQELRSLADVLLLRMLVVKYNISTNHVVIGEMITQHLSFFSTKNQYKTNPFFKYKDLEWKENFINNLLQVLYVNDIVQCIPHAQFAQLINGVIHYSYVLSLAKREVQPYLNTQQVKGRLIPVQESFYVGSTNYAMGIQVTDADVILTQMTDLIEKEKDFNARGMQVITRYKSMKIFKTNQINFMNMYLLKFCLLDDKFESIFDIYAQLVRNNLKNRNYFMLNELMRQVNAQIKKCNDERIMYYYAIVCLICDYFKNQQLMQQFTQTIVQSLGTAEYESKNTIKIDLLSDQTQNAQQGQNRQVVRPKGIPISLPIQASSQLVRVHVNYHNNYHPIQKMLKFGISIELYDELVNRQLYYEYDINFNNPQINKYKNVPISINNNSNKIDLQVQLDMLDYLQKDNKISIDSIVVRIVGKHALTFNVKHLYYNKHKYVSVFTKLRQPQINIKLPYQICYINETIKFIIQIEKEHNDSIQMDTKFTVKEQQAANKTQVFVNLQEKMNLVNSKCYHQINKHEDFHVFYLHCNKIGPKLLKFFFNIIICHKIKDKELKTPHTIQKDVAFKVNNLFRSIRVLKENITGKEIYPDAMPINQKVILTYGIRSSQMVNIMELGHHKNPKKYIKTIKQMKTLSEIILTPQQKLKNTLIFQVLQGISEDANKQKVFLISFYAKWNRIDMDLKLGLMEDDTIENLYVQDPINIEVKMNRVQIVCEQGRKLQKMKKQHLCIAYRNLTQQKIYLSSIMENNQAILRIGDRAKEGELMPKSTLKIKFDIVAVRAGYHKYPRIRSFLNGKQLKQIVGNGTICVI